MDISNKHEPGGEELIEAVVSATGLPELQATGELHKILETSGHDPSRITLDELRAAMLMYLESVNNELSQE